MRTTYINTRQITKQRKSEEKKKNNRTKSFMRERNTIRKSTNNTGVNKVSTGRGRTRESQRRKNTAFPREYILLKNTKCGAILKTFYDIRCFLRRHRRHRRSHRHKEDYIHCVSTNTVKPVYSGHLRFQEKSPLCTGLFYKCLTVIFQFGSK